MLTSRNILAIVAVPVLALAGWSAPKPGAEDPAGGAGAGSAAASAPAPAGAAKQPEIVLLTDGRIVKGVVSEEDAMIVVTQPIGTMKFPKRKVEKVFATLKDVYAYKLEQFPENDFDERINLAKWCLSQKMEAEARQQLEAVLERSPKHAQAKAMLVSLDQAQSRMAMRGRDPAVRQTAAEQVQRAPADRPGVLDASIVTGAVRGMGIPDFPVIYDLPRAQAVKRFDEFGRYVHPVLQTYCARCHNERYDGAFQLISFKKPIDRTAAALRANLDATLKLVDQENPAHSELLSSALRPHGRGPNPRPIFRGSNDGAYQILATWVNRLQAKKPAGANQSASMNLANSGSGETFGDRRGETANETESGRPDVKPFVTGPVERKMLPPLRAVAGQRGLVPDTNTDPDEFPVPFAVGGGRPRSGVGPQSPQAPNQPAALPALPPLPASTAGSAEEAAAALGDPPPAEPPSGAAAKKPRKPIKLDPKILEKALQLRNQNRQQPGASP